MEYYKYFKIVVIKLQPQSIIFYIIERKLVLM